MMERCIDLAVKKIFKVSVTEKRENCKAIRFYVRLGRIDEILKKKS